MGTRTTRSRLQAACCAAAACTVLYAACLAAEVARVRHTEFRPGQVWTDVAGQPINAHGGGILYHDGTYYWYGEIKQGKTWLPEANRSWGGTRVEAVGVSCYSSRDLYNWRYEGNVLPTLQADAGHELHRTKVLERPKVVYNRATRRFVMWLHVDSEDYSLARAGVAHSDSPTGPFRYLGSLRPNGAMSRDMTVFVDDDGQAYLFHASEDNATMHICLLTEDYLRPSGRFVRVFEGRSMEAPAVFKHQGRYYLMASGCTGWAPNAARSAVADAIWGPWRELGNPCRGPEADVTFRGQGTFVLPVADSPGRFIFMGDRWNQDDLPASRYLWLPIRLTDGGFEVVWRDAWRADDVQTLADARQSEGPWTSLFNGKDLQGWTPKIAGHALGVNDNDTFRVQDGLLTVSYDRYEAFDNAFGHLFYTAPFSAYRLRLEYRFVGDQAPGGPAWALRNSGIMIHCQPPETMGLTQSFPVSLEVQLLGGNGKDDRTTGNLCTPGTHVVMKGSLVTQHCINSSSKTFHGDQWVQAELEVRGGRLIRHLINGQVVLEYGDPQLDEGDADAQQLLKSGANKQVDQGYVCLQAESHPVQFRNIQIQALRD